MDRHDNNFPTNDSIFTDPDYRNPFQSFQNLMRHRIRDILLVSSLYDLYLFEEDGRLYEQLRMEYQVRNLSNAPEIVRVSSGKEALHLAESEKHFDLIICTLHVQDMAAGQFARIVTERGLNIPIVLLAYDNRELRDSLDQEEHKYFDRIFIWQGNLRLLIAIVKYLEDRMNVEHDTSTFGVQVILVIEDNINFYSSFLPLIYTEIMEQSRHLITEGMNLSHRLVRMRARPKILLCSTYEEAISIFEKYSEYILGVISDVDFMRNGKPDPEAGFTLAKEIMTRYPDISILLQSNRPENEGTAKSLEISFALKDSPVLMNELRDFILRHFGFGDFVFSDAGGTIYGKASDLLSLEQMIADMPDECILYHVERNHFSNWLKARTEFWLAHKLRPHKLSDFPTLEALRDDLIASLKSYREMRQRGIITDFTRDTFDSSWGFARIGGGSMGGKARGLSFINTLLQNTTLHEQFSDVEIFVPATVVLGTDVFDHFVGDLRQFALNEQVDEKIDRKFLETGALPEEVVEALRGFLEVIKVPLAVRSSSLLEDSQYHPFAGVYSTYMIPNNNPDPSRRLQELLDAVKLVYASTYYRKAKQYIRVTPHRLEEEKMAVIIQKMVGLPHGSDGKRRFYPDFAGVAKSYNFYPVAPQAASDGLVSVALGLGKTVVEGGWAMKFSPPFPDHLPQLSSPAEALKNNQHEFFALDLGTKIDELLTDRQTLLQRLPLSVAEEDGVLNYVASTYSPENEALYSGTSRQGVRVVTFAPVLKNRIFPLPEISRSLLDLCGAALATPVEIELAVNVSVARGEKKQFAFLQLRPLVINREIEELDIEEFHSTPEAAVCWSAKVLGNGIIRDIRDIIVVDRTTFDRSRTRDIAGEINRFNNQLMDEGRPYLLIGLGRWGSLDPWLGIPVTWEQICGARAIIETGFEDLPVEPSQGSHFFQNITSFMVGYFTVDFHADESFLDWEWLLQQEPAGKLEFTRHLSFKRPVIVKMNGHQSRGVILKP
jgi:CheY-like chemotaxis protein